MPKKREKEISLSEKLSSLIHTKPSVVESEDEDITTVDKIAHRENDSDYSADELDIPKFRKINDDFLEDDTKYSGKGVSRRDLHDSESEIEDDLSNQDEDSLGEDEEAGTQESNGEDDEEFSESEASETHPRDNNKQSVKTGQEELNFNKEIISKATSDIEKGRAIKNQLHIWDFLLECRMKFQKSLVAANQMPNYKDFVKFKTQGGPEFESSVAQCRKSLKGLLNSLLSFQEVLLNSNEDFVDLNNDQKISEKGKDNEEIKSQLDNYNKLKTDDPTTKSNKLNKLSKTISERHENFKPYRNNTIQKWNDKTRIGYISNKNFSAFEQSTLKQIEHVLLDKERLIKRTQTKRTNYHILGQEDKEVPPSKKIATLQDNSLEIKNKSLQKEIFDDDDFYHQLLSDLVKRKANDVTDPVQLGKQWMQLQKVRSKMKKTVDVKASKGRKVRFVVHPKLVNFMMPIDNSVYNEEARVELFNSMFGKSKN